MIQKDSTILNKILITQVKNNKLQHYNSRLEHSRGFYQIKLIQIIITCLNNNMEIFPPFRSTFHRQQKYYSEKKNPPSNSSIDSIFTIPKRTLPNTSLSVLNPEQFLKTIMPKGENKFLTEYQSNLKKTALKHSKQILNQKNLEKVVKSFIDEKEQPRDHIIRNKSSQLYTNKNMAFKTLNILYRTIIETKARKKQKEKFQLSAKKLPILEKNSNGRRRLNGKLSENSSFNRLKLDLTVIDEEGNKINSTKQELTMKNYQQFQLKRENERFLARTDRFKILRDNQEQKQLNQIIPWNQSEGQLENEWFY